MGTQLELDRALKKGRQVVGCMGCRLEQSGGHMMRGRWAKRPPRSSLQYVLLESSFRILDAHALI